MCPHYLEFLSFKITLVVGLKHLSPLGKASKVSWLTPKR